MNRRLVTLSAVALLLAAYVGFTEELPLLTRGGGEAPKPTAGNPAVPRADATPAKLNPLQGLDPNSYADILEHPLFNPGRQPRPPAVAEQPPAPAEQPVAEPPPPPLAQGPRAEDYVLLGVGGTVSDPVAALRVNADSQVLYLRKGQSVGAWTVLEIGARDIVIGTPEDHVTVALFKDSADASGEPAPAQGGGEELAPAAPPPPAPQ